MSTIRHCAFEILNCGKKSSKEDIIAQLQKIGINKYIKLTKGHNSKSCRVTFETLEDREYAISTIKNTPNIITDETEGPWKLKSIFQRVIRPNKEKLEHFQQKTAGDAVAPWRGISYKEQIDKKQTSLEESNKNWTKELGLENGYELKPLIPSPILTEYRNKLDFTIGYDSNNEPCVGFRIGAYKHGGTSSLRVDINDECLFTCPKIGLHIAKELTKYLKTKSKLSVFDQETKVGFWRSLSIRYSETTQQLMICIRCNTSGEEGEKEKELVCNYFQNEFDFDNKIKVTSMYWQWWDGVSFQVPPEEGYIHIFGTEAIEEILLGKKFKLSIGAFFQVNTKAAEVLFNLVKQIVEKTKQQEDTLLLDICCGTGVIGLLCGDTAKQVVGVELSNPAVEDARVNAVQNNLQDKTKFICAKAESVLQRLLTGKGKMVMGKKDTVLSEIDENELELALQAAKNCTDIVAIVDPPRSGLNPSVLKALLRCSAVGRIIYVSCNPTGSFVENAKILCGTGKIISNKKDVRETEGILPFRPLQFIPVDLFPNTEHCELVAEFVRDKPTSSNKRMKSEKEEEEE